MCKCDIALNLYTMYECICTWFKNLVVILLLPQLYNLHIVCCVLICVVFSNATNPSTTAPTEGMFVAIFVQCICICMHM